MSTGFIKLNRGETEALLKDKNAWVLLSQIALRARWNNGFNTDSLSIGEALIGDHRNIGLSQSEYRTAKAHLVKYGFATFRTTNRGTVAKLMNTRIFDINSDEFDMPFDKQTTSKQQLTRKKEGKNEDCSNNKVRDRVDTPDDTCLESSFDDFINRPSQNSASKNKNIQPIPSDKLLGLKAKDSEL